ncbi:MAG: alpha/beta fold hydrolase [bacterium]
MAETALMIDVGDHALEARYQPGAGARAIVLCHPHPQYGGSMDNNVVLAARDALGALGFGTLRFNFRGVGRSGGAQATGLGEADDLAPLLEDLAARDADEVHLAGYSYGAWVALQALRGGLTPASLLLFSPPLDFLPFEDLRLPDADCLITVGDRDEYCAAPSLQRWLDLQPGTDRLTQVVLPGGDHFYWGQEGALKRAITEFASA